MTDLGRTLRSRLTAVVAVLVVWAALSPEAMAQSYFPSNSALDSVINYYNSFATALNARLLGWAQAIFGICATIQAALFLWNIMLEEISRRSLSSGGVRGLLQKLLAYTIFIGLTGWLLTNNADLTRDFNEAVISGVAPWVLANSCFSGAGTYADPISPGEIVEVGWWTYEQTNENMYLAVGGGQFSSDTTGVPDSTAAGTDAWYDTFMPDGAKETISSWTGTMDWLMTFISTPSYWVVMFAMFLIIPTFYVIAFQVIIAHITLALIVGVMPIFLAFLPLSFTSPIVSGYVRYYLYTLFKLLFIYILLVPVLQLPAIIFAGTTGPGTSLGSVPSFPIADCTGPLLNSPDGFDVADNPDPPANNRSRADLALAMAAFALAAAAILKTIPERIASYMTARFSLRPLYDIFE